MNLSNRLCMLVAIVTSPLLLPGQNSRDTIRSTENYRWQPSIENENTRNSHRYIGFQANQLLRQLLGSAGSADNPYLFAYSVNSISTGRGMNFGLGFNLQNTDDFDPSIGLDRETKSSSTAIRIGYDFKKSIGKRWISGFGVDVFRNGSKSKTKSSFAGQGGITNTLTTKTNGLGLGPRFLLLFNVSEKIYLGTETTVYYMFEKTTSQGDSSIPTSFEQKLKENSFVLGVPTALFLMLRF